ncbi:MAG: hypothetical protein EON92_18610, partial [Burkholderiales bacterium]
MRVAYTYKWSQLPSPGKSNWARIYFGEAKIPKGDTNYYTSTFRYTTPVQASYNEARMTPVSQAGQTVVSSRVTVSPQTWSFDYRDHWGTAVTAFEVLVPHESMVITAEHVVVSARNSAIRSRT